jgi:uncharacterized protein YbjQ (UPF0145 family)
MRKPAINGARIAASPMPSKRMMRMFAMVKCRFVEGYTKGLRKNVLMLDPTAIVTFDRIDGYRVVRTLGTACGEAVLPHNRFRSTLRSVGAFIGLAPIEYLTDIERVRPECLCSLVHSAELLGANGVLSLRFESCEMGDGSTRLRALGNAVVLEPSSALGERD